MANNINYEVDPNDSRLTSIKGEEKSELSNLEQTYADMQTNTDKHYDSQIKGWEDYGKKQTELQKESHKLTVQGIEQNMADAKKDYIKEQSGAYVDWQRQSNQYGANAEQMAASGLTNTGFSESSQVSMYNTYQNRIMTARESFVRAETDFKNQIAQAKLSNDTLLAEIAFNTLKETTALAIQQAQYKNQLLMDLTEKRTALKSSYWQRYSDMMTAIQREIAQKEDARQYNATLAEQKRVNDSEIAYRDAQTALAKKEMELKQAQINAANAPRVYSTTRGNTRSGSKSAKKSTSKGTTTSLDRKDRADATVRENANDKTQQYTPDMKSIMALGFGPLSAKELDAKIRAGVVQEYKEGGKLKYRLVYKGRGKDQGGTRINLLN